MKAIIVEPGKENNYSIKELSTNHLSEYDVLIRTNVVGLNHIDKQIFKGEYGQPPEGNYFLIPGHEAIGEIIRVGDKVRTLKPGDIVVPTVRRPCDCINCKAGQQDMCTTGNYAERGILKAHGFLSEYILEDPIHLVVVPEQLGELGVLLHPSSVAEKAIRIARRTQERLIWRPENALVTGSNAISLLAASFLKLRALNTIIVDKNISEEKLELCKQIGVNCFDLNKRPLHEITELIGAKPDIIIEFTESNALTLECINILGINGIMVLVSQTQNGNFDACASCLNKTIHLGNKAVIGSESSNKMDYTQSISDLLALQRRWPGFLERLITKKYSPEQISEAINNIDKEIKVVINFSA